MRAAGEEMGLDVCIDGLKFEFTIDDLTNAPLKCQVISPINTATAGEKRGLAGATKVAANFAIGLLTPTNKKPHKKAITAKSPGLTEEEFNSIKPAPIKKKLNDTVHKLNCQVDADWHGGYEQQAETKGEWFEAIYFLLLIDAPHWQEEDGPGPVQQDPQDSF